MGRAKTATDSKDFDLAIRLLNAIIDIRPYFTEAWNRRATVYYTKKDFGRALADIYEVLAREPRHFGALSGLGIILQELGDDKGALDAFRRALAIHPHLERIPELVQKLSEKSRAAKSESEFDEAQQSNRVSRLLSAILLIGCRPRRLRPRCATCLRLAA